MTAPGVSPGGNYFALPKSNPIGGRPGAFAAVPPGPAGAAKIGSPAGSTAFVRSAAPALTAHPGGISGTGIARPGTAPGGVGGPAKLAGGITGTGMKAKK
jgi:hypothetical protein